MTANRRPGFRLPWTSDEEKTAGPSPTPADDPAPAAAADAPADAAPVTEDVAADSAESPAEKPAAETANPSEGEKAASNATDTAPAEETAAENPAAEAPDAEAPAEELAEMPATEGDEAPAAEGATPAAQGGPDDEPGSHFLRDLVAAMRGVADEARRTTIADVQTRAEARVSQLERDAEQRRAQLQAKADSDVAGVSDWEKAEAERIRQEAEQRVAARRAQLEQQLAAEAHRGEAETRAVRDRLAEYERELDAYHAQLSEIADPAAFAAAAKRMPNPPNFTGVLEAPAATPPPAPAAEQNGTEPEASTPTQARTESLADRLAALRAEAAAATTPATPEPAAPADGTDAGATAAEEAGAPAAVAAATATADAAMAEPTTTDVIVRGLGSFGAITGFRQALSGVDGIDSVSLSLGQSGEFVFKASHPTGFDIAAAIVKLEGDAAKVEASPTGGLHVTLDRPR